MSATDSKGPLPAADLPGRLRAARLAARAGQSIGQSELAARVGVSQATISDYERGRRRPSLAVLTALVEVLGVSPDWLLGRDEAFAAPGLRDIDRGQLVAATLGEILGVTAIPRRGDAALYMPGRGAVWADSRAIVSKYWVPPVADLPVAAEPRGVYRDAEPLGGCQAALERSEAGQPGEQHGTGQPGEQPGGWQAAEQAPRSAPGAKAGREQLEPLLSRHGYLILDSALSFEADCAAVYCGPPCEGLTPGSTLLIRRAEPGASVASPLFPDHQPDWVLYLCPGDGVRRETLVVTRPRHVPPPPARLFGRVCVLITRPQ